MKLKLGKLPARPGAVKLKFGDYVNTSVLPTPPTSFGHDNLVGDWGILANDQVGDCAIADALHQTLLWNLERGVAIPLDDDTAIRNYSAVTGYDPNDPTTDQGTDVPTLVQYRLQNGLVDAGGNVHKIGAAVALNPSDWEQLIYALYYFDGVTLGVAMYQQWMNKFTRTAPSGNVVVWDEVKTPKVIGGHAITGVAFHDDLARIITWGTDIVGVTETGYSQASDETYAFFSEEKLRNGVDLEGFDTDKLVHDLPLLADVS